MIDSRKVLLKAVQSEYPLPKEPTPTIPELLEMIHQAPMIESAEDQKNEEWNSILINAVNNNHEEIVKALLEKKVNPNVNARDNKISVLHRAAFEGYEGIVRLLLAANANVDSQAKDGHTPLFSSIAGKKNKITHLLLEAKANPNLGSDTSNPLNFAVLQNRLDLLGVLFEAGAIPGKANVNDLDMLLFYYGANLDGNIQEGIKREEIAKVLPLVHIWLNYDHQLNYYLGVYRFLRLCDQKEPLVQTVCLQLCERIKSRGSNSEEYSLDQWDKKYTLVETLKYLKKLQVVLEYMPEKEPNSPWLAFSNEDPIASQRKFGHIFDARKVEELYEHIRAKQHPYLYMFGLAPHPQPEENKMSLSKRSS